MKNVTPSKFLVFDVTDGYHTFCDTSEDVIEVIDELIYESGCDYDKIEENVKVFGITSEFQVKYGKAYLVKKGTQI